jgi:NitT/TauT family transport system substrate-binding protein
MIIVAIVLMTTAALYWWQSLQKQTDQALKTTGLPMKVSKYYWPGEYWHEIAHQKGWFKEAGLNVELVDTNADYYQSLQDTADGKIDVQSFYFFDLIRYHIKGYDLVAVILTDTSNGVESIVAKNDIQSIASLRGKTVGVKKHSNLEYVLSMALMSKGLSLSDIVIKDMPTEQTSSEFKNKLIDAFIAWEPYPTEAIAAGGAHKLFTSTALPGVSFATDVFKKSFLEERPGDVQAYVNVWHRTTQYIQENPETAFGIIATIYNVPASEVRQLAQLDKILNLGDNLKAFTYGASLDSLHGSARKINDYMIKTGLTDKELDSTEFLDPQFVRRLQ